MQIHSYGDKISKGIYSHIHSVFDKVVNFTYADKYVISVVKKNIGAGSFNIVVSDIDLDSISSIEINENIIINNHVFDKKAMNMFDSNLPKLDFEKIDSNIDLIARELEFSPEKSLAVLLYPEKENEFSTSFDKVLIKKIKESVENIFTFKNIVSGSKSLKGIGYGLTPSGDDFVSGILTALNLLEIKNKSSYIELVNEIFETVLGENRISNNSFYISKKGLCNEKLKLMLLALSEGNEESIRKSIQQYINIGETSGADYLTGLYLTYKKFVW